MSFHAPLVPPPSWNSGTEVKADLEPFWEGILGPLMEMPTAQLGDDLGLAFLVMEKAVTPPHPAPISLVSPASPRQRRGVPFGWVAWSLGGVKGDRRSRPHAPLQTPFSPFPLPQGIGGGEKKEQTEGDLLWPQLSPARIPVPTLLACRRHPLIPLASFQASLAAQVEVKGTVVGRAPASETHSWV